MAGANDKPDGLTTRQARPEDAERLASLMFLAPSREALAMAGSASAGEHFQARVLHHTLAEGTSLVIVVEIASEPVGFAQLSRGSDSLPFPVLARASLDAMGLFGSIAAAWRSTARQGVELRAPGGGLHLVELQVSPERRNRGIGALLLDRVDAHAIDQGAPHISLSTASDNPARRLYERSGYRVLGQKTNARYQRITGSEGRVLMIKSVGTPPSPPLD